MLWLICILTLAFLFILFIIFISFKLSGMVVRPETWDYDATYEEEIKNGAFLREKYENEYDAEEFYVDSSYGYSIHCVVFPQKPNTGFSDGKPRVVVIAHGISYTLCGSVKYAEIFRNLGFICVLFDERNHGKSGKALTTMGYYESKDLATVCSWARKRFGENCILGTHGESMGAATVMMHAPTDPKLAFVIEDCGYSDLSDQLYHCMHKDYHLPRWPFMPLASFLTKLRGGIPFYMVKPAQAVALCPPELPMLFIHGSADSFVPTSFVHTNYESKRGIKSLSLFEGSEHVRSWFDYPQRYAEVIEKFLRDNHII